MLLTMLYRLCIALEFSTLFGVVFILGCMIVRAISPEGLAAEHSYAALQWLVPTVLIVAAFNFVVVAPIKTELKKRAN